MREILFKAKRKLDGAWVVGDLSQHKTGKKFIKLCGGSATHSFEVDENTICQYTGLTDKNGNKIWENDIVHLFGKDTIRNYDWKAVVEFGNPNSLYSWGYQLKPIGHFEYNEDILCWVGMEEANIYCEVIGNIFDNADLLKGE